MPIFLVKYGTYTFGSNIESWQEILDQQVITQNLVNRNGVAIVNPSFTKERQIQIKGSIGGSEYNTLQAIRDAIDDLTAGMNQEGEQELYLFDDRYLMAQKVQFAIQPVPGSAGLYWRFEAAFLAADPFWRSSTLNDSGAVAPTTTPETIMTLTNNGNAVAPVQITVSSGAGSALTGGFHLENLADDPDQLLDYGGTIAAGTSLVIDETQAETERVLNNGEDDALNMRGEFIRLLPGANQIHYTGDIYDTTIRIKWRDRWY